MPTATYSSFPMRSHLRALAPLPDRELTALTMAIAELGAIGRNLNRVARVALASDDVLASDRLIVAESNISQHESLRDVSNCNR